MKYSKDFHDIQPANYKVRQRHDKENDHTDNMIGHVGCYLNVVYNYKDEVYSIKLAVLYALYIWVLF